jgi:molybdopterin-biosynthesis enzyme MoeA-like protein
MQVAVITVVENVYVFPGFPEELRVMFGTDGPEIE